MHDEHVRLASLSALGEKHSEQPVISHLEQSDGHARQTAMLEDESM